MYGVLSRLLSLEVQYDVIVCPHREEFSLSPPRATGCVDSDRSLAFSRHYFPHLSSGVITPPITWYGDAKGDSTYQVQHINSTIMMGHVNWHEISSCCVTPVFYSVPGGSRCSDCWRHQIHFYWVLVPGSWSISQNSNLLLLWGVSSFHFPIRCKWSCDPVIASVLSLKEVG